MVHGGGRPPYGFRFRNGKLIPHADEQAVIAAAEDMRADGLSLRAIGARLDRLGYATRYGRPWHPGSVASLLHQAALAAERARRSTPASAGPLSSPTITAPNPGRNGADVT